MSSTIGVRQWFQGAPSVVTVDSNRHTRDFGITFNKDDSSVKALPPMPPLIPLGAGRRKRRRSSDSVSGGNDTVSGSIIMVNNAKQDNDKLLRLFGGGDSDSGVSVHSVEALERMAVDHKELSIELTGGDDVVAKVTDVCSESGYGENSGGPSRCTVLLDPIPTDLLKSLSSDGSISAEKAAKTCHQTHEWEESLPMISDNEVQGLLLDLVDDGGEEGEEGDEDVVPDLARSHRQESLLQPPPLREDKIDCDDVRDGESRDETTVAAPGRKLRHRKCETPRKAVRRRRERRSGSSGDCKRRKRSTSSSTTSSACSTTSRPHKHHHKHRHRHRSPEPAPPPARPRVNPIFVWVKQDDTRIVEVLCEDYDKRNRIRLTKTPHGWRAIPRTERLSSIPTLSAPTVPTSTIVSSSNPVQEEEQQTPDVDTTPTGSATVDHHEDQMSLVVENDKGHPQDEFLSQQTKLDDEEMPLQLALEASTSSIDETLGVPLSPKNQDCSPQPPLSHGQQDHEDDESADEGQMELGIKEYQETSKEKKEEITDASVKETDTRVVDCEEGCSQLNQDNAQPMELTVHEEPSNCDPVELVAEPMKQTVEQELKQVVQKDDVVQDETVVNETTEHDVPEVDDLVPTDLTVPKTSDADRPPPKVVSSRSLSSILRSPKILTPTLLSSLQRDSTRHGTSPALPEPTITPGVQPAHQTKLQHKSMFLESLLSSPRKCHQVIQPIIDKDSVPLDLGKSSVQSSSSPTIICSAEPTSVVIKKDVEVPKLNGKVDDITLKNLLNRRSDNKKVLKEENLNVKAHKKIQDNRKMSESMKARKSRLLELLTASADPSRASLTASTPDLDPLAQLKKILSDPDMAIPDPLLVPRDRLQELVTCPAKEIPRLLTLRPELRLPEALAYPSLLQDPNLLVVSISYLQNLIRSPDKPSKDADSYSTLGAFLEWQRYQSQQLHAAEFLESQLKQQAAHNGGREVDAATAQAINQMMWLPYLNQLEASALACGNNQEFLNMLNVVFPAANYPNGFLGGQYPPGMGIPPGFMMPTDYKSQMELQHTMAMWQEAMMQSSMISPPGNNNNNNSLKSGGNPLSKDMPHRTLHSPKKCNSSARTSPIAPNFHPQPRDQPHLHPSRHLPVNTIYPSHHPYNPQPPRSRQSAGRQPQYSGPLKQPKSEVSPSMNDKPRPTVKCKPLLNLLASPRREEELKRSSSTSSSQSNHSHLLAALGKPSSSQDTPTSAIMDLSSARRSALEEKVAKLKVKQHLVDPSLTPKLLKQEIKPEVAAIGDDKVTTSQLQSNLWHPLFGSQKASYNSPWQWTTVTVNGE